MFDTTTIYYVDLDDTLFFHKQNVLNIYVRNGKNHIVDCIDYHSYIKMRDKTPPQGCFYDFSVFSSAAMFKKSAVRNTMMFQTISNIKKHQSIEYQDGRTKIEILTARSDFDNQELFAEFMMENNIDINNDIHVRRAGNEVGTTAGERKVEVINREYSKGFYKYVIVYDDCRDNLETIAHKSIVPRQTLLLYHVHDSQFLSVHPYWKK